MTSDNKNDKFILGKVNNGEVSVVSDLKDGNLYLYPKVFFKNEIVYTDTNPAFYDLNSDENRIIILKSNKEHFYILLVKSDPILNDKLVILSVTDNVLTDHYEVIKDIMKDVDEDGFLEVGGKEIIEGYCLDCDSAYYNPYKIYKLGDKFEFDQNTSEKMTKELYGVYLGNEKKDTVVKVFK